MSLSSEQVQELIAGYVLGELSPDEGVVFANLLAEHPEIMQEISAVQQALELAYAPLEVAPPAALRATVLAASVSTPETSLRPPERSPRQNQPPVLAQRLTRSRLAGLAAAALIMALGIANYRMWQTLQALQAERPEITPPLTYTLEGTPVAQRATATVVVDPATLEAVLTVNDLPPLPTGKVYVLWTVVEKTAPLTTDPKNAILTQVFQVDKQGEFSDTIAVPVAYRNATWVTRLAVTAEDATAPQAHKGAIALSTAL